MASEYNLTVLGIPGVGKSTLTIRFSHGLFTEELDPTLEDSYHKQSVIDGQVALLDILDTANQETYLVPPEYAMRRDGFLIIYSITSHSSFKEINSFYQKILQLKQKDSVPAIIVGNKCDLENERQVSINEGRDLADHLGCKFIETSAKDGVNVDQAFIDLVREIRKYNKQTGQSALAGSGGAPGAHNNKDRNDEAHGCCAGCVIL